jgi:beta-N-acetylhexosaminidase
MTTLIFLLISTILSSQEYSWSVNQKLKRMTLDQKIGQMLMIDIKPDFLTAYDDDYIRVKEAIEKYHIGGLILFRGEVYSIAYLLNEYQKLSKHPLLISSDYERGVFQQLPDGTHFPSNMAIAATGKKEYAYFQGKVTAEEARSIGVHMILAPVLDVNNNSNNPIINFRSYGENPDLVAEMGLSMIKGLQDHRTIATAKHFPGHGDTSDDSHSELPILELDRKRLDSIELKPFKLAIDNGLKAIMTAHIALPKLHGGLNTPATKSKLVLDTILRQELGFKGIIISDAFNMKGVNPHGISAKSIIDAVNAGIDIILMPINAHFAFYSIKNAVNKKLISVNRINESVKRILHAKYKLGLYDKNGRYVKIDKIKHSFEKPDWLEKTKEITRESITILKNYSLNLPILNYEKVINLSVSSDASLENPGKSFYSELKKHHPNINREIIDFRTDELTLPKIKDKLRDADLIIISVFARTSGGQEHFGIDSLRLNYVRNVLDALTNTKVIVSFGSPFITSDFAFIENHIAAYSYSTLVQRSAAEAITKSEDLLATSPVTVPLVNGKVNIHEDLIKPLKLNNFPLYKQTKINNFINNMITDSVFPGATIEFGSAKKTIYRQGYGHFTYNEKSNKVSEKTIYDLASLTKVFSTTLAIMRLYEKGLLDLESSLDEILPEYIDHPKSEIQIKHLLTHSSGLLHHKEYFREIKGKEAYYKAILDEPLIYEKGTKTKYSDLGFILLMQIVERISGKTLDQFIHEEIYQKMNLNDIRYLPNDSLKKQIAPTENVAWRGKLAQGVVHDENATAIGGVSGHAGLFSSVADLGKICQMLLNKGWFNGQRVLRESTIQLFTSRANTDSNSVRAFGWDKPSPVSSSGIYISDQAFGHYGFTGTSVWIDPKNDLYIIHLSNRVYPSRDNIKIRKFRPRFFNLIMELNGKTEFRDSYKISVREKDSVKN